MRWNSMLNVSISFLLAPLRGTFFEKLSLSPPHGSISLRVARSEELGTLLDLVLDVDHPVEPRVSLLSFVRMTDEALNWIHELVVVLARSEEHTSELQSLMRISYAVFCLKNKTTTHTQISTNLN